MTKKELIVIQKWAETIYDEINEIDTIFKELQDIAYDICNVRYCSVLENLSIIMNGTKDSNIQYKSLTLFGRYNELNGKKDCVYEIGSAIANAQGKNFPLTRAYNERN